MDRYLIVEGVADDTGSPKALVTDPWGAGARRFLGVERREPQPEGDVSLCHRFTCKPQLVRLHQDVASALAAGDLKRCSPTVVAKDAEAAERAIKTKQAAPAKAPKKDGE